MVDEIAVAELAAKWGWPIDPTRTALEFMAEAGVDPDTIPVLFNPEEF